MNMMNLFLNRKKKYAKNNRQLKRKCLQYNTYSRQKSQNLYTKY